MMKHFVSLIAIFVIVFALVSGSVIADQSYPDAISLFSGSQYKNPKMACKSSTECLVSVYDNSSDYVRVYYTNDGFATWNQTTQVTGVGYSWELGYHDYYNLPIDVAYDSNLDTFWVMVSPTVYKWDNVSGLVSNGTIIANHTGVYDVACYGAGFIDDEGQYILAGCVNHPNDMYVIVFDNPSQSNTRNAVQVFHQITGHTVNNVSRLMGFAAWRYNIALTSSVYNVKMGDSDGDSLGLGSIPGFPDTYTGLWHYNNATSYLYYRNNTAVKRVSTTSFSSWGSPQDVHLFGSGENISSEDRQSFAGFDWVVFQRTNASESGVYILNTYDAPSYTPAEEYVSGTWTVGATFFWQKIYAPKVDCEPDMQHCLMLVYDTGLFGVPSLSAIYTTDGFATPWSLIPNPTTYYVFSVPNVVLNDEIVYSQLDYSNWPYDVVYNQADDKYYILAPQNTQGAKLYSWSIGGSLTDLGMSLQTETDGGTPQWINWKSFQFQGKGTSEPLARVVELHCSGSPTCRPYVNLQKYYLNGTYLGKDSVWNAAGNTSLWCLAAHTGEDTDIDALGGMLADTLAYDKYDMWGHFGCSGSYPDKHFNNMGFTTDYLGFDYHKESQELVFKRDVNATVNKGNWRSLSSDFVTYSSPQLYYSWDLASSEEITRTDRVLLSTNRVYAFQREHSTNFGIYTHRESVFPIYLFARYQDPVTGAPDLPVNVSATLVCPSNFTSTDSGSDLNFFSTCDSAMDLYLYTSGFFPASGSITFDKIAGCDSAMFVRANFLPSSYIVNMTVRDQESGAAVPGATVTIGGTSYTTDAYGKALVTVQPVLNPHFVHYTSAGSCTEYMQVNGTARQYYIQVTATSYRPSSYYNYEFVDKESVGGINYFTYKDEDALVLYLNSGADVTVRVYNFDGVPVSENLVSVKCTGATETYVLDEGVPIGVNTATEFPAIFRLVDASPSYTATFNLSVGDYYEVKTKNIVSTTIYYSLSFTLPESESYQCVTVNDCSPSYCQGTFHYTLDACTAGFCIYDVESCTLCDDEIGCYEDTTSTSCFFDTDCIDTCLNSAYLTESSCGSGNVCLEHVVQCSVSCVDVDEGEDYCAEAPPSVGVCDQTTVTGMMECLQAGVMSFIGSVYDPAFAIMLVLFLVIIIGTVIALAMRGVQNVIR